jgi:DMSO reductase family type II enzyme chaperone
MNTHKHTANERSQHFQLLALGFTHPVEAFHRLLTDESYSRALVAAAAGSECSGHFAHQETREFNDFEADYIHLFQMGRGGKPIVPLNAGDHDEIAQGQGRPEFLLEYSGWYRHFGLKINTDDNANELPDHLACQLEFMAWLAHLEESAGDKPELLQGYQRAQRDFLERHMQPFLEVLTSELLKRNEQPRCNPLYLSLAAYTLEINNSVLAQLNAALIESDQADAAGSPEQIAAVNLWG